MKFASQLANRLRIPRIGPLPLLVLFIPSNNAFCEWAQTTIQPFVSLSQQYNDNFNLSTDELSVWSTRVESGFRSNLNLSQWESGLAGRYVGEKYYGHPELNRNEGLFSANGKFLGELSEWSLHGSISFTQPSSSELGAAGIRQFNRIDQTVWNAGPSAQLTLSERFLLDLSYRYSETSFHGVGGNARSDFQYHSAFTSLNYAYSEAVRLFTQLSFVHNDVSDQNFKSDHIALQVGFSNDYSDTLKFTFAAGGVMLFSEQSERQCLVIVNNSCLLFGPDETETNAQSGFTFSASLEKQFEYTVISLRASRNLSPTFNGGQTEARELELGIVQKITRHMNLRIGGQVFDSDTLQNTLSQAARTRYLASANLDWNVSENWRLAVGYNYNKEDREFSDTVDRNLIFVSIQYNLSPFIIYP